MMSFMNLLPLLLTVFIDSLGFGLVFPLFSPLLMNVEGGILPPDVSLATRGLLFGLLISSFCVGQFFGGPILGAVSDRKGRKKVLLLTLWLALFSYVLSAVGIFISSVIALFVARILSGVAAGNYSIAQSVVVDCSEEKEKTKNFGLLGMAWGVGFIIGPYLGGKLADPELSFGGMASPFWFAALLCLINAFLVMWRLKESLPEKQFTEVNVWTGVLHLKKAFQLPALRGLFIVMFIFSLGWGFFTEFSPLFLMRHFNFDYEQIGNFYACVGLWIAFSQGVWIRPFLKKFSPHSLLLTSLISLGIVLPFMLLIKDSSGLFWLLPLLAFPESFIYPTVSTLVSNLSSKETQGEMLGINNSVQWAAIGISPMFSGALVALYPHLPITFGSACMFVASIVFIWVFRKKRESVQAE